MKNQINTGTPKRMSPIDSADSTLFPLKLPAAERTGPDPPPDLSEQKILRWADAFFERNDQWPDWQSGPIPETGAETWYTVAAALALGLRGLSHRSSLDRLIKQFRRPAKTGRRSFSVAQILRWVDAWIAENGRRPTSDSGAIPGSGGLDWSDVNQALRKGGGVLRGGSSLAELLTEERPGWGRPPITEKQILFWADSYHRREGRWPHMGSGPVLESPGDSWCMLDTALKKGYRTLPGDSTLAELLRTHRGDKMRRVNRPKPKPRVRLPFEIPTILAWADAHRARTGKWPCARSGLIPEAPRTTWGAVHYALRTGTRGLPRESSIALLLSEHRGIRRLGRRPKFQNVKTGSSAFANPVLYSI